MESVELVPVGHKYSPVYKINPNNISQVIFENTIKTIHQVWNNTNGNIYSRYTVQTGDISISLRNSQIFIHSRTEMQWKELMLYDSI